MVLRLCLFAAFFWIAGMLPAQAQKPALRLGIAGLTHSHVNGILGRKHKGDVEIVGIAEPDRALAEKYAKQYGFSMKLVYNSLDEMIQKARPQAVADFADVAGHLKTVQTCAPRGIHVMVEKPLAINGADAMQMASLAKQHHVQLLTNYETTWYPSYHEAAALLVKDSIGPLRKLVVRDGHKGPKNIQVPPEFFNWLTDPMLNGGGAITDFGCYGANLSTWLLNGQEPLAVTAITRQLQPQNNPRVDDEAIILLQYDSCTAILEPSWNWPIGRKDMELYGTRGELYAANGRSLRQRVSTGYDSYRQEEWQPPVRPAPYTDAFSFLASVINGTLKPAPYDLSSLENNMVVMKILDAARESARTGKTVKLR